MEAKDIDYAVAMSQYRRERKEMEALLYRMLGGYGKPKRPLKEVRRQVTKQLGGISVSRMIIEAR